MTESCSRRFYYKHHTFLTHIDGYVGCVGAINEPQLLGSTEQTIDVVDVIVMKNRLRTTATEPSYLTPDQVTGRLASEWGGHTNVGGVLKGEMN